MAFIKIKPAKENNIVRHPNNMRLLKPEGEEVEHNSYWERRLKDGDVTILEDVKTLHATSLPDDNETVETHGRASLQDTAKNKKSKNEDNT